MKERLDAARTVKSKSETDAESSSKLCINL